MLPNHAFDRTPESIAALRGWPPGGAGQGERCTSPAAPGDAKISVEGIGKEVVHGTHCERDLTNTLFCVC